MSGALGSAPVGAEEFLSLIDSFDPRIARDGKIAIAVSGGPDSMALAFCTQRWAKQHAISCIALIVDHGLRKESNAEATKALASLHKWGIATEILQWEHETVTNQIHEKARAARYALLTQACNRHGAADLMIAHHRDDQAETILMRLCKGSGVEGLAGMKKQSERGNVRLLRPFLSLPKARLIATCERANIDFVTDPSNQSDKFARGRLRTVSPLLEKEGMTVDSLLDLSARAAEACDALAHYTDEFLRTAAIFEAGGAIRLDCTALSRVPRAIAMRALHSCLRQIHCDDYPPERAGLSALLVSILANEPTRTLYGCLISIAENAATIMREPAVANESLPFQPDIPLLWDQRWIVSGLVQHSALPLTLRALGNPPHELIDLLCPHLRHTVPQGRVRATLPALWRGDQLWAIPSFDPEAPLRMAYRKHSFPSKGKML